MQDFVSVADPSSSSFILPYSFTQVSVVIQFPFIYYDRLLLVVEETATWLAQGLKKP